MLLDFFEINFIWISTVLHSNVNFIDNVIISLDQTLGPGAQLHKYIDLYVSIYYVIK